MNSFPSLYFWSWGENRESFSESPTLTFQLFHLLLKATKNCVFLKGVLKYCFDLMITRTLPLNLLVLKKNISNMKRVSHTAKPTRCSEMLNACTALRAQWIVEALMETGRALQNDRAY